MAIAGGDNWGKHAIFLVFLKVAADSGVADLRSPLGNLLGFVPKLLLGCFPGEILHCRLNLDRKFSKVTHTELQFTLVLDKDLQVILNLEQAVISRICEDLDHMSQLWVQLVHIAELLLGDWHLEFDSSRFSDLFSATFVLDLLDILIDIEERLAALALAR